MKIKAPVDQQIDARNRCVRQTCGRLLPDGRIIKVLPGFVHDGSSKPQWTWSAAGSPFTGLDAPCSFWHDVLFRTQIVDFDTVNLWYVEDMKKNGCDDATIARNYQAVQQFGRTAWNENKKNIEENRKYIELYKKKEGHYEKVEL